MNRNTNCYFCGFIFSRSFLALLMLTLASPACYSDYIYETDDYEVSYLQSWGWPISSEATLLMYFSSVDVEEDGVNFVLVGSDDVTHYKIERFPDGARLQVYGEKEEGVIYVVMREEDDSDPTAAWKIGLTSGLEDIFPDEIPSSLISMPIYSKGI